MSRTPPDREIWFVPSDEGGTHQPVHRNGCMVFAATAAWILVCGTTGVIAFAYTLSPWAFAGMVTAAVPALLLMACTIRRHS